jgi:hypothetical protein
LKVDKRSNYHLAKIFLRFLQTPTLGLSSSVTLSNWSPRHLPMTLSLIHSQRHYVFLTCWITQSIIKCLPSDVEIAQFDPIMPFYKVFVRSMPWWVTSYLVLLDVDQLSSSGTQSTCWLLGWLGAVEISDFTCVEYPQHGDFPIDSPFWKFRR